MTSDTNDLVSRFERLDTAVDSTRNRLDGHDERAIEQLADAYRRAFGLLEDYRDKATGSGDFGGYVKFRSAYDSFVEELDEDLPHRSAFEASREAVDRRRLSGRDFDRAKEALEPVGELVDTLEELSSLKEERREIRNELLTKRRGLIEQRDHLKSLAEIQPSALDVPVESLQSPIDRYNEAVTTAHREFLSETSATDVLATYDRLSYFTLVTVEPPPAPLSNFLNQHSVGEEPISTLREYLSFSRSKLGHYVGDPGRFKGEIGPHSDYLDSLSVEPFLIDWPPPERQLMRWRLRDLIQMVDRFAGAETIELLRTIQSLCRNEERYSQLRSAARLNEELDEDELELVLSREVQDKIVSVTTAIETIDNALD